MRFVKFLRQKNALPPPDGEAGFGLSASSEAGRACKKTLTRYVNRRPNHGGILETWLKTVLCGLTVLATHLIEGVTGFGSSVLALPFLIPLVGIRNAVPMLCVLNCVMAVYLVCRSWQSISWREFGFIALWVAAGLPVGLTLYEFLPAQHLCVVLGTAMIVIGADGVRKCRKRSADPAVPSGAKRSILMRALLFCGGIIQGAFGSGGPFIVIYAAKALPEKSLFRVTLSLLWLATTSVRLVVWTIQGTVWNRDNAMLALAALPFMVAGVLIGDWLHHRVDGYCFRLCVYLVLGVAGAVMFAGNLLRILG